MLFSIDTPSEAINDMIEHGIYGTTHLNFNEYLASMIEEFFPDANLGIIKKMIHWSRYPTLKLFTLEELREIEINERTKEFNEKTMDQTEFDHMLQRSGSAINVIYSYGQEIKNWNQLYQNICSNYNRIDGILRITSYVYFVEIIQSIWNSSNKRDMIMEDYESTQITIQEDSNDKDMQITELKNENQLMKNQLMILKFKVGAIERKYAPELIKYDYELIKSRIDTFRDELKITQRIFARIIQSRNIIPLAIPIAHK